MKTDTSTNLMLVVFCVVMIGFVIFSTKVSETLRAKQAAVETTTTR
jgi:hypothetical protein